MLRFLVQRLGQMLVVLFCFVTLTYFVLQAMPGDFTSIYAANPKITPEVLEHLQARFGLDQSVWTQYLCFIKSLLTGDLGVSFSQYPMPVWDIIKQAIPRTFMLFYSSTLLSFYIGFLLGKTLAWRRGGRMDTVVTAVGITFYTAFYPLVAFVCIWLLAFKLKLLPLSGFMSPSLWQAAPVTGNQIFTAMIYTISGVAVLVTIAYWLANKSDIQGQRRRLLFAVAVAVAGVAVLVGWWAAGLLLYAWDIAYHMLAPVFVLSLVNFGGAMLLTRDTMLETIGEEYVAAASARGLSEAIVRDRYAARNALLPVATSLALSLGSAIGGGVVTETLFSWPGLGRTLLSASLQADLPLAIGAFLFTGVFLLIAHLLADLLSVVLDPRLRSEQA